MRRKGAAGRPRRDSPKGGMTTRGGGGTTACTALQFLKAKPMSFLVEVLRTKKKFWLLPLIVAMVLLGGLVALTKGSAVAPFIYTLF
jgi:hypothetical protein